MPDTKRHRAWIRRAIALTIGLVAILAAIAGLSEDPLETGNKLASIGSLLLGALGLIVTILSFTVSSGETASQLNDVATATDLAKQIRRQWQRERHLRQLDGADLIPVSWHSTARDVAASPADVLAGAVVGRPTSLRLGGTIEDLGEKFRQLPRRRLVVLGEPGSGKSTLLLNLTIQLLELRSTSEAVPVLLNLATWDPREDLESWLVRQLVEEYPNVAPMPLGLTEGYTRLVNDAAILPILDGLDEIPDDLRATALTSLGLFAATEQAFVISCRSADYATLVATTGQPISGAAVVEIDALTTDVAASYLEGSRWDAVRTAINSQTAVSGALQTPLMLHLARTVYATPGTNPDELLDTGRFPSTEEIEDHLLAAYLPAAYEHDETAGTPLTYLAKHTGENISWWNLHDAVVRWPVRSAVLVSVVAVLVMGLSTSVPFGRITGLGLGFVTPVAVILGFVMPVMRTDESTPRVPLPRSLLLVGLPVAATTIITDGLAVGVEAATRGLTDPSFLEYYYFHFAWVGLKYAICFELGQTLQAFASAPRPPSAKTIGRALASCLLTALYFTTEAAFYSYSQEITWMVALSAFTVSAAAYIILALQLPAHRLSPTQRQISRIVRFGTPPAIAASIAIALDSLPPNNFVDSIFLYIAIVAAPTWLMTGMFSKFDETTATDAHRGFRPVKSAVVACLLVFIALAVIIIIGSLSQEDPPSEYLPLALIAGAIGGTTFAALGLSSTYLATPARDLDQTDPRIALRRDRRAALVTIAGAFTLTVFLSNSAYVFRLSVIVLFLLFAANSRWLRYMGARTLLWLYHALPWQVTDFLADAHDRGVLRRTGSVYQFRHVRIKESLVRSSPSARRGP